MEDNMTKIKFFLTLLASAAMFCGAAEAEKNYLNNADFEKINPQTSLPEEWSFIQRGSMDKHCEVVSGDAVSGSKSMRIYNSDPELKATLILGQSGVGRRVQYFKPDEALNFSVMAKAEKSPAKVLLYFEAAGKKTKYKSFTVQPGSWQKINFDFAINGPDYVAGYVGIKLNGAGSVLFDDANVRSDVNINNMLANYSFEDVDAKNLPKGWIVRNRNANGSITVDSTMAADGKNSMRLSSKDPKTGIMVVGQKLNVREMNKIKPGTPMRLSIKVNTNGDPGVKFIYYIERVRNGKRIKGVKSPEETSYFGWMDKSLTFDYPDDGPMTEGRVWVMLLTPGNLNVDSIVLAPATEKDLKAAATVKAQTSAYVRAAGLPIRHTYFAPDAPKKLTIESTLMTADFKVELIDLKDGKVIKTYNLKNAKAGSLNKNLIDLPKLELGSYKLFYSWKNGSDQDYFRIRSAQTRGVTFNKDNIMLLNGKPFFPIGVYPALETRAMFEIYGKSGINTVVLHGVPSEAQARNYAKVINPLDMAVVCCTTFARHKKDTAVASRAEVEAILKLAKHFPKLLGSTGDEFAWGSAPLEKIRAYYEAMFLLAPDYIAWQNHAPRLTGNSKRDSFESVRRFTRVSDITGIDIYPVPGGHAGHNNLPDKSLACVGKYTDLVAQTGWGEVPVWMILQGFSWDEYNNRKVTSQPLPTYHEQRFMVWNAITHGARGIFYYQPGRLSKVWYEQFGKDMSNINRELAEVTKIIANGKPVAVKGAPEGVVFNAFNDGKNTLFVAVNESKNKSVKCTLPLNGKFYVSPSGKAFTGKEFTLAPYGVLLLTTNVVKIAPEAGFTYNGPQTADLTINGSWVVHPQHSKTPYKTVYYRQEFNLDSVPAKAVLRYCHDDTATFVINGNQVKGGKGGFRVLTEVNVAKFLKKGKNVITGTLTNGTSYCGVVYEIKSDKTLVNSGEATLFSEDGKNVWVKPLVIGKVPCRPWMLPHTIERY